MYLYKKCSVKVKLQYRQKTTQFSHFPETRMYRDFQPRYELRKKYVRHILKYVPCILK